MSFFPATDIPGSLLITSSGPAGTLIVDSKEALRLWLPKVGPTAFCLHLRILHLLEDDASVAVGVTDLGALVGVRQPVKVRSSLARLISFGGAEFHSDGDVGFLGVRFAIAVPRLRVASNA